MNVLLIGNGGREHALAWKIKQSPLCEKLFVAPGNAGTSIVAENISIGVSEFEKLGAFCLDNKIELVVVGPEVPLVNGIRDYFEADPKLKSIWMVGPGKMGAQLEGSKDFSKQFMLRNGVPTAKARTFYANQFVEAAIYLETCKPPLVLKADGLAAGKGVIITSDLAEAKVTMREMLEEKKFGEASAKVLVEEFLNGIELSVFVLTDGEDYVILPEAKDYKRIGDGDTGPNTGGMGSVSPVPFANADFMQKVEEKVVKPTIAGLKKEQISFKGFIFVGLMNVSGEPYVIEYNTRMGDPETQSVMARIQSDFLALLLAAAKGELKDKTIEVDPNFALTIVVASDGYPDEFEKGKTISGLEEATGALVFHAGTRKQNNVVLTDGGRVLGITGKGKTLKAAQANAYAAAEKINWDGVYYRWDIGKDLM
ncbi:MAG: phosphoribosylamine--glycine ligase [Cytophagales bacterium]|jgi:phosphoribosylamine--glycine ligase|nr:phosphoribosylamine--glycine ligase [Cytophagales bacterium]MCA6387144.1 phosphoribosylamine--glycine ligase [Cytophagales bacterium]MCA6390389.1 phosphoribosylamine--glycine ligase [Cytophagales bacterium]MCA6395598.1 phosphoribosylamine--glycine ligase [Cytophagales bacterium]MCA6399703.1 phosphoribosylamine--glycine ligase [Cytophagales bacterium]